MPKDQVVEFTETNIYKLFGDGTAETEKLERLKEFYFKTRTYEQVVADTPLRILIGHKGIGKSALFKVAMAEDPARGTLPISIYPDDVKDIGSKPSSVAELRYDFRQQLIVTISLKILGSMGIHHSSDSVASKVTWSTGELIPYLVALVESVRAQKTFAPLQEGNVRNFLQHRSITVYIDDMDQGIEGGNPTKISALISAIRLLSADNPEIRFRMAFRIDTFFLYSAKDEARDKIQNSLIWHCWTNHDILILLAKRIETFFGRKIDEAKLTQMHQPGIARYLN
jgi:hypothetical protein